LLPIPDDVTFDQAVLADPFAVSLHAILKAPPADGARVLIYGCGTLGLLSVAIVSQLYPHASIVAIARYPFQEELARRLGAAEVIRSRGRTEIIERVAALTGARVYRSRFGGPWLLSGVDVIYDTIGSAETLATGLRVSRPRAAIVITGVSKPARFEWTPHYFKEIQLIGSNAFGVEEFEGKRLHAMEIYLRLLSDKRLALPPLVTHRFRLDQYREALLLSLHKGRNRAVKTAFDFALA
jgi:threonine dehydrogenase-like Zn-dependent dehydrogenase